MHLVPVWDSERFIPSSPQFHLQDWGNGHGCQEQHSKTDVTGFESDSL